MQDYLLFQLYAPLASWGGQAVGQERPTDNHPSRSALLGLLGAALGIERQDEARQQALRDSCHFGIKVYEPGITLRDFHTIQAPPDSKKINHLHTRRDELREEKQGTTISFRSYQQEQVSVSALWLAENAQYTLEQLQNALEMPYFQLYLGRKSCPPAIPFNPVITTAGSLRTALDDYCIDSQLMHIIGYKSLVSYYWEQMDGLNSDMDTGFIAQRYDQPLSRQRWQFAARDEYVWLKGGDKKCI